MALSLVTAAVQPALDYVLEVQGHLRVDSDDEKPRIEGVLVPAAVAWLESYTGRALVTQTWKLFLDRWPCDGIIRLPKAPLQSVTHIKYTDANGTTNTWAASNYLVDAPAGPYARPGRITPKLGSYFPVAQQPINAIEVQFVCGYGADHSAVPALLRAALLLHVAEQFERRESSIVGTIVQEGPLSAKRVADSFRLMRFDA